MPGVFSFPSGAEVEVPLFQVLGPSFLDCPQIEIEKSGPLSNDYCAFTDFVERMRKTHRQMRCPTCGKFTVWNKRPVPAERPASEREEA